MSHYFKTYSDPINKAPYQISPRQVKVIGVIGEANSGKDTFAKLANKQAKFFHLAFAYPMKHFMRDAFGLSKYAVHNPFGKQEESEYWNMSNRRLLQLFGTEAMQPVFGKTVWCKCLHKDIHEYLQECQVDRFVISDMRFPHELEYILRELDGVVVHIKRPQVSSLKASERGHASESIEATMKLVNDFTNNPIVYTINNDGPIEQFEADCAEVIQRIVQRNDPNSRPLSPRDTEAAGQSSNKIPMQFGVRYPDSTL